MREWSNSLLRKLGDPTVPLHFKAVGMVNSWDLPPRVASWNFIHWTRNFLANKKYVIAKKSWSWFEMFFQWRIFYHPSLSPPVLNTLTPQTRSLYLIWISWTWTPSLSPNTGRPVPWQNFPVSPPQYNCSQQCFQGHQLATIAALPAEHDTVLFCSV